MKLGMLILYRLELGKYFKYFFEKQAQSCFHIHTHDLILCKKIILGDKWLYIICDYRETGNSLTYEPKIKFPDFSLITI